MCTLNKIFTRFKEGWYLRKEYVSVEGLPFSFAHISDLHFGDDAKFPSWVQHSVYEFITNNAVQLLCVTGDLVDKDKNYVKQCLDFLYSLPVNYVVVSLGNHDEPLLDTFFQLANNYSPKIFLSINYSFFYNSTNFICLPDTFSHFYQEGLKKLDTLIDPFSFNVALSHNPNSFHDLLHTKINLVLSGHTHGGQIGGADWVRKIAIKLGLKSPICNTLRINHEHDCFKLQGSVKEYGTHLHINNGLGYHKPMRMLCPPTITIYKPHE